MKNLWHKIVTNQVILASDVAHLLQRGGLGADVFEHPEDTVAQKEEVTTCRNPS